MALTYALAVRPYTYTIGVALVFPLKPRRTASAVGYLPGPNVTSYLGLGTI